tara:strand:+ start:968 stop:1450 length:483 start_codon:yes stop_codon:yes gene_type:complete
MKVFRSILLLAISCALWISCKTTATAPIASSSNHNDIIGSWEGCDGRIITFSKTKPLATPSSSETTQNNGLTKKDFIIGRYSKLGGLTRYQFTQNEIGYKLIEKSPGHYTGMVKWQDLSGIETWKEVTIHVDNDTYRDDNSDSCSKVITRIKNPEKYGLK